MPELLGKFQPLEVYDRYFEQRAKEIAIDGLYAVMLRIESDKIGALMLPGLVTGIAPQFAEDCVMVRMPNREMRAASVRVSVYDGLFNDFDSSILAPAGNFGPNVPEGYLLEHPVVSSRDASLRGLLDLTANGA